MHQICRTVCLLLVTELINGCFSKHIRKEPQTLHLACHGISIFSIIIENNFEIIDNRISIRFNNTDHFLNCRIDDFIFLFDRIIVTVVFNRDGICELVICQNHSVPVQDTTSGSLYLFCFLDLKLIVIQICLSVYDL